MWHLKGGKAVVSAKGASGSISSEACSELTLSLYRVSSIRSKDHCCCCWRQTKRECSRRRRRGPKTESILTETICISTEHTGNNSSTRRNWDTLREMPQLLLLLLLNQLTRRRLCVCMCARDPRDKVPSGVCACEGMPQFPSPLSSCSASVLAWHERTGMPESSVGRGLWSARKPRSNSPEKEGPLSGAFSQVGAPLSEEYFFKWGGNEKKKSYEGKKNDKENGGCHFDTVSSSTNLVWPHWSMGAKSCETCAHIQYTESHIYWEIKY